MGLKLAIWDVDGTLVDSRAMIQQAMVAAFEACQLVPPDYDQTRRIVGLDLSVACQQLAPEGYRDLPRLIEAYKQSFIALRAQPDFDEALYPGALSMLETLAAEGWLLAIATGKSHRGLEALFEAHPIKPYFDSIWCADDGPGKPHPFMCEQAMSRLGVAAEQSLIIGDAIHDMRMGQNARISTIGISWGFGRTAELKDAGAQHVCESFQELRNVLTIFQENSKIIT